MLSSATKKTELGLKHLLDKVINSKNTRGLAILGLLVIAVLVAGFGGHHSNQPISKSACGAYRADKVVTIGSNKINAEVVESPIDKEKGLSGRPCIQANQGMLFVYSKSGYYSYWMKDMKFAIDIIWISTDHKTAGVERNVEPSTYPASRFINDKQHPAQYVLELKANRSTSLGMTLGTPVKF